MADDEKNLIDTTEDATENYGSTSDERNPENESEEELKQVELNDIYEMIGLGRAQYLVWTLVGLVSYADYAELALLSVIMPALRCEWKLSSYFEAAITMSAYGSYALFSILFGKISDKYGRKTVLQWATILLIVSAMLSAAAPNKWIFLVCRFTTGAAIGINVSCIVCYGTEFAESKYRAIGMTVFVMTAFGGVLLVNGVAFLALRAIGWRWFLIVLSLPAVPALAMILVLPESPRYLCVSGQQVQAMHAVRFIARVNDKELPKNVQMICFEDEELGKYSEIFNEKNRKPTIALSVIYFNNLFIEMGMIMLLPLLFTSGVCRKSAIPTHKCKLISEDDLWKLTVVSAGGILGSILALLCAQRLGRLWPLRISSCLIIVAIAGFFVCLNQWITFGFAIVTKTLECFTNTLIWIIIPESFSTNIRSTATGFINSVGKIGGVFGTTCVYLLFYRSPYILINLFLFCAIFGFIASMIYDKETKDAVLQEI